MNAPPPLLNYACNTADGLCFQNDSGEYSSLPECQRECQKTPAPTNYTCNLETKSCFLNPNGVYDTLEGCQDECKVTDGCDYQSYFINCRDAVRNDVKGELPPNWKPLPWNADSCARRCPHYFQKGSKPYVGYECMGEKIDRWCNCDDIQVKDAQFAPSYCLWKREGNDNSPCVAYNPKCPKGDTKCKTDFTGQRTPQLCMSVPECANTYCNELWSQGKCNYLGDRTCLNMMGCLAKKSTDRQSESVKDCLNIGGGTINPLQKPTQYTKDLYQCLKQNRCISENAPPTFSCDNGNCVYDEMSKKTYQQCLETCDA